MIANFIELCNWFRGKAFTLQDLLHMDIGYVITLNKIKYEQEKSEQFKKIRSSQEVSDAMVDEGMI